MNTKVTLKPGEERRLRAGHLWVFSNEIALVEGAPGAGDTVELYDASKAFLGTGFYNPHSLIAVRLLTAGREALDIEFWKKRLAAAVAFRQSIYPGSTAYRAVFGESDGLPGLVVDRYGEYLAVQFLSAGLEKNRETIIAALRETFAPRGIVARNESSLRRLEGLEEKTEVLWGEVPERVAFEENGCRFNASLTTGQKTGFFFDQRENRAALAAYCRGKRLLDGFCHTGAFGIEAARAGARDVVWVDSSRSALELAEENAGLNALPFEFNGIEADVPEYLASLKTDGEKFDIINIDPPALIKSKKHFQQGYKAYRKLNTLALELLGPGGILATSSCSHNLGPEDFRRMLQEAAGKARKQVVLLEMRGQSRDHPVLLSMPETEYLKFAILEVRNSG